MKWLTVRQLKSVLHLLAKVQFKYLNFKYNNHLFLLLLYSKKTLNILKYSYI